MSILNVILAIPASSAAPDVPTCDESVVNELVKCVGEGWCSHVADPSTLVLFVPANALASCALSREHFVQLLEYCEERLHCKRVLACFPKAHIDPRQGIPRALKCIGFKLLHPDQLPAGIDRSAVFAMVYNI